MTYPDLNMLIAGQWRKGSENTGEEVINPATGTPLAILPHASSTDLDEALDAAQTGFETWRRIQPHERAEILRRAANLLRERREHIATILTLEQGKTITEARAEVSSAADYTEWFAEEGRRSYGRIIASRESETEYQVRKHPVGVSLSMTPWNFPINTPSRKIAAGLAAGCAIIAKAAEETPASAVEYVRAIHDAGVPAGAIQLVFGVPDQVSWHLMASPVIRKVSFTGSIPVGKHIAALAAGNMQRATMELGGHAPVVVFDDIDLDRVLDVAIEGKLRNAGQVCVSPTRFYVQENVYNAFVEGFVSRAKARRIGNGLEAATQMGPLANTRRLDAMDAFVADAEKNGARILTGGARQGNEGFYYPPTVIADAPDSSMVMTEEPFGPIAPITSFTDIDDVCSRANALQFGLAGYAFTQSLSRAREISERLETGMIGLNTCTISLPETPFAGCKESGYGIEGASEGLEPYLVTRTTGQRMAA